MLNIYKSEKAEVHDIAYCSFRALCKAINYSTTVIQINEVKKGMLEIGLENIFYIDEKHTIKLPAQAILNDELSQPDIALNAMQILEEKSQDLEFKKEVLKESIDTYKELKN
jgi:hypothetical protein